MNPSLLSVKGKEGVRSKSRAISTKQNQLRGKKEESPPSHFFMSVVV